ncbi:transglutaminase domain-containing protein [Chitinophaga horti]|uniref:Transglutaminase domain-containing protein n=1 Tax=Chitinophaga horti TaxID=2920382 RepID=A0ABY6IYI8_9BACT|nr:transglutaminase domain-containing protein [Chitinophaga horti]UYQ92445.1 transglutaminase domain-containing protein [Chitinophaga horti]
MNTYPNCLRKWWMFACIAMFPLHLCAQDDDDRNITIREMKQRYEFITGDKDNPVKVRENAHTVYRCNEYRGAVRVAEFYDDKSTIDDIRIYVNNEKAKYIKPEYRYYEVEDFFFSDMHVATFVLPLEKKGTESYFDLVRTTHDPRYLTSVYFHEGYYQDLKEIAFAVPRWMHVDIKEMNFAGFQVKKTVEYDKKTDADIYVYTMTNLPARADESMSRGPSYIYPHLLVCSKYAAPKTGRVNFFNSVDDLYAWYHSLVQTIGNDATTIKPLAQSITKNASTDIDKIKAVYNWVQENIRYIAFEDGIAGFRPAKAQEVLQKKYGDCKGMANLTKELLKSLGYDARLCWIGTNHIAYDYSIPSLSVDNHMICGVKHEGKLYFLDATESYIGFNKYAERIQGRQVMVEDGDKYFIERIPLATSEQNAEYEKRVLRIDGNDLAGITEHRYTGESTEFLLTQIHGIKKEKLQDALQSYLSEGKTQCAINNLQTSSLHDWNNDLTMKYDVQYKNAITGFGNDLYLELDFRKEMNDLNIDTTKRKTDLLFSFKRKLVHETELQLPDELKVSELPKGMKVSRDNYDFSVSYEVKANKILYRKELIIKNTHLPKTAFGQWNDDVKLLAKNYLQQISFTKK